ncbi:MAG: NCS2 family permease [Mailhella sp.]|nr:NCS2 family permease [Mailhella sp.]
MSFADKLFRLEENGTSVKQEVMAGLTTFVTMAYVIFVVPAMVSETGMPKDALFAATIWATALTTLFMGFWANMPIALAPGMGIIAYFTYSVVLGMSLPWQTALGAVFISGAVFLFLSATKIRAMIIASVPKNLTLAISVGIGMFIAFIGLRSAGIVVSSEANAVALGNLSSKPVLLSLFSLVLTGILLSLHVRGAILIGILVTTAAGMAVGAGPVPHSVSDVVNFSIPSVMPTFMQLDILAAIEYGLVSVLFTMTMVDLFDSIGTIIGVSRKAGLMNEDGTIRGMDKALIVDSCGTIFGSFMGTPAVTSYVESSSGVAEGGRTGLTAVTVGVLFLICLVFAPVVGVVQSYATAPALIIVGALMAEDMTAIDFKDMTESLPAFLTMITMPLTYSIANGFGMGFISYVILKTCTGRIKEVSPIMWIVSVCFAISFVMR